MFLIATSGVQSNAPTTIRKGCQGPLFVRNTRFKNKKTHLALELVLGRRRNWIRLTP